jgi:hypothetical protein
MSFLVVCGTEFNVSLVGGGLRYGGHFNIREVELEQSHGQCGLRMIHQRKPVLMA